MDDKLFKNSSIIYLFLTTEKEKDLISLMEKYDKVQKPRFLKYFYSRDGNIQLDENILKHDKKKELLDIKQDISKNSKIYEDIEKSLKLLNKEMKQVCDRMSEINTKINNSISKGKINIDIINENDNSDLKLNNIKIDEENEIKFPKKKKEKIKNMIIITKKLLKESRVKRKFNKLISHNDFEKKMEISKNKPKIKLNTSNSNRNLIHFLF